MFEMIKRLFPWIVSTKQVKYIDFECTDTSALSTSLPEMLIELRQKGYTQKQMSQELDIPVNKVKSELHKLLRNGKIERKTNRIKVK